MKKFWKTWWVDKRGSVAVLAALGMVAFVGFAALAVDIGRVVSVKAELQKAADAAALAGARRLIPYNAAGNSVQTSLDWTNASVAALATVQQNSADGNLLNTASVQTGWWSQTWVYPGPANLQATSITPTYGVDWPAVKVSISKTAGVNNGAVVMLFGPLLGKGTQDITVQSVAGLGSSPGIPGGGGGGPGFPQAVPLDLVEQMLDAYPPPATPPSFRIGSAYHSPAPDHGQWTTFKVDNNSVPYTRDLIDNGNPEPVNIGDNIWIQPGTMTTLYSEAATRIGETVLLPVVGSDVDLSHKGYTPLVRFVPFYIEDARGGSNKYIEGHFVNDPVVVPGANPGNNPNPGNNYSSNPALLN